MVNRPGEVNYVMAGVGEGLKLKYKLDFSSFWLENGRHFDKSSVESIEKLAEQPSVYGLVRPAGWEHHKDYTIKVNWKDGKESIILITQGLYSNLLVASMSDSAPQGNPSTNTSNTGSQSSSSGGCYVATCVYGSYDCPQVWTLRRFRDDTLGSTWYGRAFIRTYYAISPTLVKWFGKTKWFKRMWKGTLDRMVKKLENKGVENTPYEDKNW